MIPWVTKYHKIYVPFTFPSSLQDEGDLNEDMPEMASLSNRFSFFENFESKEQGRTNGRTKDS